MADTADVVESMLELLSHLMMEMDKFSDDDTFHEAKMHSEELQAELEAILSDSY